MTQKNIYGVNLDLDGNEIQNVVIHSVSTLPASPTAGQLVYYSPSGEYFGYNGATWDSLTASGVASWSEMIGGILENTSIAVGSGTVVASSGGIINANRYFGNEIIPVTKGGTGTGVLVEGALIYADSSGLLSTFDITHFYVQKTSGFIGIGNDTWPVPGTRPAALLTLGTAPANHPPLLLRNNSYIGGNLAPWVGAIEFHENSGLTFVDGSAARRFIAWKEMSITGFSGVLQPENGGIGVASTSGGLANIAGFTGSGQLIYSAGSGIATMLPSGQHNAILASSGGIPLWSGFSHSNLENLSSDDHTAYIRIGVTSDTRNTLLAGNASTRALRVMASGATGGEVTFFDIADHSGDPLAEWINSFGTNYFLELNSNLTRTFSASPIIIGSGSYLAFGDKDRTDNSSTSNTVRLRAPDDLTSALGYNLKLPPNIGTSGHSLVSDGSEGTFFVQQDHGGLSGLSDDDHVHYVHTAVATGDRNLITSADAEAQRTLLGLIQTTGTDSSGAMFYLHGSGGVPDFQWKVVNGQNSFDFNQNLNVSGIISVLDNNFIAFYEDDTHGANFVRLYSVTGLDFTRSQRLPDSDGTVMVVSGAVSSGNFAAYDGNHWKAVTSAGGGASQLNDLSDVSLSSPDDNHILIVASGGGTTFTNISTGGTTFPSDPFIGQTYYRTDYGENFRFVGSGVWLGELYTYLFGRSGSVAVNSAFRTAGNVLMNSNKGYPVLRDMRVLGFEWNAASTVAGDIEFRNGGSLLQTFTVSGVDENQEGINLDFDATGILYLRWVHTAGSLDDPCVTVYARRRLT